MHFRLIGRDIGRDYASLGAEGFSLSVERMVAGERRETLFSAASLLDLVHRGAARVLLNHRYLETTLDASDEEVTVTQATEDHSTESTATGWRRAETGEGVAWPVVDSPIMAPLGNDYNPNEGPGFASFSNAEIRTRNELLGHEGLATLAESVKELILTVAPGARLPVDATGGSELVQGQAPSGVSWKDTIWAGIDVKRIGGVRQISLPPSLMMLATQVGGDLPEALRDTSQLIRSLVSVPAWIRDGDSPPAGSLPSGPGEMDKLLELPASLSAGLLNGLGMGFNVGVSPTRRRRSSPRSTTRRPAAAPAPSCSRRATAAIRTRRC
jgi:hypothetical protein